MPALITAILLSTSLGCGAADAVPLASAFVADSALPALPVVPVRWRYRYSHRDDKDPEDNERSIFWRREGETPGVGALVPQLQPSMPRDRQRRGRWVDPPPAQ